MKFFLLMITIIFILQCSSDTVDKRSVNWLASINNTVWINGIEQIVFSTSGKSASGGSIDYIYTCSETSDSGLYQTNIEFPPTRWYLFRETDHLYRYGPFLYRNDVNTNESSLTTIFMEQ